MVLSRSKERERAIMTESTSGTSVECPSSGGGRKDKKIDFPLLSVCFSWAHGELSLGVDFSQPRSAQQDPGSQTRLNHMP